MCRKCGEPDRRGSAQTRRRRTLALLEKHGNGVICPCTWCGALLGARPGYLQVTEPGAESNERATGERMAS